MRRTRAFFPSFRLARLACTGRGIPPRIRRAARPRRITRQAAVPAVSPLSGERLMSNIVIVYHSGYGHTQKLADAVHAGAQDAGATARLIAVGELDDASWAALDAADAIVFGAPTYMGG
ncbi:NADPH-dependent FMN reductase, partial [Burkholderia sp. A9]